jgi:hypothetical protein
MFKIPLKLRSFEPDSTINACPYIRSLLRRKAHKISGIVGVLIDFARTLLTLGGESQVEQCGWTATPPPSTRSGAFYVTDFARLYSAIGHVTRLM